MTETDPGAAEHRPDPSEVSTGAQLRRWYWLRTEIAGMARRLGVSPGGGKQELTDRVAAALDGRGGVRPMPRRTPSAQQLDGPLTPETVLPAGQRCSQHLRAFFTAQVGPGFTFDAAMRSFVSERAGATLGDAVEHWHATRTSEPREIDSQFELNRFTRRWSVEHPDGTRADLHQAWAVYRATPTDRRDRA